MTILKMDDYDFVIIGAGPAGLAFAQICARFKKRVLILERENSIGGCHRVRRVNGIFTEHGPRIYSDTYKVFKMLLKDMGLDFYKMFTKYNFQMSAIGRQTIWNVIKIKELIAFTWSFINLTINEKFGENMSMEEYMKKKDFSEETKDLVDRLCRLTDGAGADRYTLHEFLSLFNQQALYSIYQPKKPNDKGLFKVWREHLEEKGYVDIRLNSKVEELTIENGRVKGVKTGEREYKGNNYILAVPPSNLEQILMGSGSVNESQRFGQWVRETKYNDYISITFHYDYKVNIERVYGFPRSDWGLAYIVLSDYMEFEEPESKTVISLTFYYNDRRSRYNGKTANECTKEELIEEAYLQLRENYKDIPRPTLSLVSEGVVRDGETNSWKSIDTAYVKTGKGGFIPFEIPYLENVYNVGTHNGNQKYNFTSLESAVSNGVVLGHKLIEGSEKIYRIESGWKITDILRIIVIIIVVLVVKEKIKY
jgi:protoporphyrinogen oxidase